MLTAMYRVHADDRLGFPAPDQAGPEGLLAIGGDLSPARLLAAYARGIFPWYNAGQPILWWSPDPRMVLFPAELRVRRSLDKRIRNAGFEVTLDRAFAEVVIGCAAPRGGEAGTWITDEMYQAYCALHALGYAHSTECWLHGELVGGLYGVALGRAFFGESMFSHVPDASKVALVRLVWHLTARDYRFVDCQVRTTHLASLGARDVPRSEFLRRLEEALTQPTEQGPWRLSESIGE